MAASNNNVALYFDDAIPAMLSSYPVDRTQMLAAGSESSANVEVIRVHLGHQCAQVNHVNSINQNSSMELFP